jgi:hypothetical protein
MDAEQALKDAHNAVLEGKLDLAMTKAMDAVICARLMYGALRLMKEKQARSARHAVLGCVSWKLVTNQTTKLTAGTNAPICTGFQPLSR